MSVLDGLTLPGLTADLERRGVSDLVSHWQMTPAERVALDTLLRTRTIDCAIEIGTAQGGSLAVISNYARRSYSLELLPESSERLRARIPSAVFHVGDSRRTIPLVLEEIRREGRDLDFVLVDGDHSRDGVRADIEAILQWQPRRPLTILMHDSLNPDCRFGMREVAWASHPHVHAVELDFVTGYTIAQPDGSFEMWAGLGLALVLPSERRDPLTVVERAGALFERMLPLSTHGPRDFSRATRRLASLVPAWQSRGSRIAFYGTGSHTQAMLGQVPELLPLVTCFVDRLGDGTFLGRPRVAPSAFSPAVADAVVYSSPIHEAAMFASLASQPVEHVRLYA
ncbi:MAG: class I SAM-dependent methyltransferase [Acidobacteria bacterium]|nr:class I SAM-dependent methyltransferase [Acidobacteriota bacterium]